MVGRLKLQEFFIPVHGLVRLQKDELPIVDHPAFQHLADIYQLGQTWLVYRGATHTRYEHALGTRHVADMMIEALKRNCSRVMPSPEDRVGEWELDVRLNKVEERFVRLGALLHDIGHLPAGHTLEDELGLLGSHDRHERLQRVWDRRVWHGDTEEESLREIIDRQFAADATATGLLIVQDDASHPATATEIVELLISKDPPRAQLTPRVEFRVNVCRDIIGNTICADLLDYLHRDWFHIGKTRTFDTRILEYLEIRTRQTSDGRDARLVLNLRSGHRVRTDAVTSILDLLESRYQLAEIALFHRTKLCAAAMLERAIAEIGQRYPSGPDALLKELPELLLDASDTEMLGILGDLATTALETPGEPLNPGDRAALQGARRLTKALRVRKLHKFLMGEFEIELAGTAILVQDLYAGPTKVEDPREQARIGARNRLLAVRLLERDFGMAPGTLVMYCPPRTMNTKIAEVQVLVHGQVHSLEHFEANHEADRGLTGGHLGAQKDRFRRLWRVQFAIERSERDRLDALGLLPLLGRAIELCVLRRDPSVGSIEDGIAALAKELTSYKGSPLHDRRVTTRLAARQREHLSYPGGALTLLDSTEPA